MPLEINLYGFRYGKKSYGCKVLYGYDAHTPIAFLEKDRLNKADEVLEGISLQFTGAVDFR